MARLKVKRGRPPGRPPGRPKTKEEDPPFEMIPPDEIDEPKTQVREIKHKTEWVEIQPVEESQESEEIDIGFDVLDERQQKSARKRNERDELRKILAKNHITPGSNLRISIDRYMHSESAEGGNWAETEFLTKYVCTKEHVTNEDYLDVARKWGPGLYRFTLRHQNQIVTAWDKRVGIPNTSTNVVNAGDASAPIFVATPDGPGAAPVGVIDPRKYFKEHIEAEKAWLELEKLKREAYGINGTAQAAPTDPKVAALQLIAENPDIMERIGKGIASTVLGGRPAGDGDPWADVAMEAIKSGQAAEIAATIIREIMAPFRNLGGGDQNGAMPQPMPPPPMQNGQPPAPAPIRPVQANQVPPAAPGMPGPGRGGPQQPPQQQQIQLSPADALIVALIEAMGRNAPLKEAQNLINVAIYRNPELDESIDELLSHSEDEILDMLAAFHPQVLKIEHARPWLKALVDSFGNAEAPIEEARH